MAQPIQAEMFYGDGRGPELRRVCWGLDSVELLAIEYYNPDDVYDPASLKHVRFHGCQVVLITPEEVVNDNTLAARLAASRPAAMFDLGQTPWLRSFSPVHLATCSHYQLVFYDEVFDVICERVTCHRGAFDGGGD